MNKKLYFRTLLTSTATMLAIAFVIFIYCATSLMNIGGGEDIKELDKVNRCFRLLSGVTIDISKSYYPAVVMKYEKYLSEH